MAPRALLLAVSALVLQPAVGATHDEDVAAKFRTFAEVHGKQYTTEEYATRLGVFATNLAFIEDYNQRASAGGVRVEINQFADRTAAEFRESHLTGLLERSDRSNFPVDESFLNRNAVLPDSVDWRAKGAVTDVKDQKTCGSCWAFSTTGAIEGAVSIKSGSLVSLSEEELVDCSTGSSGCAGGDPLQAFNWVAKNGICSDKSYPYTAFADECHNQFTPCTPVAHISGFKRVPENNELALQAAVAQQPISIQIEADSDVFRFYKSGVLTGDGCGTALDHAVLLVGYGTDKGQDYWLVKNSWGTVYGEAGYVRIARTNSTTSWGECGIAQKPTFPIVQDTISSIVV